MWGIRGWRWIFGVALVPAAALMLASRDTAGGAGALELAAVSALAYGACAAAISLLAGLAAFAAWFLADAAGFIRDLFGLRD